MLMSDSAAEDRRVLIKSTPREHVMYENHVLESRRRRAIESLGENWVLHPNYQPNPKHSLVAR